MAGCLPEQPSCIRLSHGTGSEPQDYLMCFDLILYPFEVLCSPEDSDSYRVGLLETFTRHQYHLATSCRPTQGCSDVSLPQTDGHEVP